VTVVPQEQLLLDDTVTAAIAFADPEAPAGAVEAAARAADAHDFVSRLPHGYRTRIGQRGRTLSGGQRQRLALARALLRDAPILVLDEPTTGLDAASSRRFLDSLLAAAGDRTVLVLTHDPVVLERMDRVVDLSAARLVGAS
jgi:ATP-binding cassette, subfamily B, bacterial